MFQVENSVIWSILKSWEVKSCVKSEFFQSQTLCSKLYHANSVHWNETRRFIGMYECWNWRFMTHTAKKWKNELVVRTLLHVYLVTMKEKIDWKEIKIKIEAVKINLSCYFAVISSICVRARVEWTCERTHTYTHLFNWPRSHRLRRRRSTTFGWDSFVYFAALAFIIIDHHRDELKSNDF